MSGHDYTLEYDGVNLWTIRNQNHTVHFQSQDKEECNRWLLERGIYPLHTGIKKEESTMSLLPKTPFEVTLNGAYFGEVLARRPNHAIDRALDTLETEGKDISVIKTAKVLNTDTGETHHYNIAKDRIGIVHYTQA